MNRREFIRLTLLSSCVGAMKHGPVFAAGQAHNWTNVLLILVDDLGRQDLGCYGNAYIDTPVMDQLAAEGMRFTNAYSACPVCSPTRAALLTGKSTARVHFTGHITAIGRHRHPEESAIIPPDDLMYLPHSEVTLAEALKPAGYATASIGKWHVGHEGFYPTDQGFDENIAGWTHGSPPSYWDPYTSDKEWNPSIPTLEPRKAGEYLTDRLTDEAIEFMSAHQKEPFFCYLPHYAVHMPLQAPAALVEKYKARPHPRIDPVYAAMVERVDQQLGRMLAALDAMGLAENTAVILASDNGACATVADNRPYRAGKGHLYEGGIRVPLIVRWPGQVQPGATSDVLTISQDLYTTVVEMAGPEAKPGTPLDGHSLVGELRGDAPFGERDLHWYYPHYAPQAKDPGAAIRSGPWKLIEFYDPPRCELYNLEHDIGENVNRAKDHPERVTALRERLRAWLEDAGTSMHTPNNARGQRKETS